MEREQEPDSPIVRKEKKYALALSLGAGWDLLTEINDQNTTEAREDEIIAKLLENKGMKKAA